jgi:hypothetical protein
MKRAVLFCVVAGALLFSACSPTPAEPLPGGEPPPAPTVALPAATSEPVMPAGWTVHTSQQCEYTISAPVDMHVTVQDVYSRIFAFSPASPDSGPHNFIYVSVIAPEIQDMVRNGVYSSNVYNYDPAATERLLGMWVGESMSVHQDVSLETGFTYTRQPDTMIDGRPALTYENSQPWEFPAGTKEIRYYMSERGCTYLIGGYVDTKASGEHGAITEELFRQIVAAIRLMP